MPVADRRDILCCCDPDEKKCTSAICNKGDSNRTCDKERAAHPDKYAGKKNEDGKVTPCDLKVGDKVLFGKYSGTTVKVEGDELLVMREEDIMAVVNA